MKDKAPLSFSRREVFISAFRCSVPVLLGYITVGIAFGLLVSGTGYPWWLALAMSFWMFAGAGQFIALGLFAAGTSLWQLCLIQLVVNVRHMAYGLSMLKRFSGLGLSKPYLIFSLTDETFALLSSMPETPDDGERRRFFMIYVAVLNHFYWVSGSVLGAVAGTFIPFDMKGIGFALTALFVVLMMEQIKRIKKPGVFIVSAASALMSVFFIPGNVSILAALALALLLSIVIEPIVIGRLRLFRSEKHEQS